MPVLNPQDLVDDISVIGQENETGRILVEPSNREDSGGMTDFSDDVSRHMQFGGGRHSDGLVIFDVDNLVTALQNRAVTRHQILGRDLIPEFGDHAVDRDTTFGNQSISLPSGTQALFGKKFIDAHGGEMTGGTSA
jgi:hypothetical protein